MRGREGRGRRLRDGDRPRRARRAAARASRREFGADLAVDVDTADPVRALRDATGALADVVVDVTAKAPAAFGAGGPARARPAAPSWSRDTRRSRETPGFDPDLIVYKELRVLGALGVDTAAYTDALELLATRTVPVRRSAAPRRRPRRCRRRCSPTWPARATCRRCMR